MCFYQSSLHASYQNFSRQQASCVLPKERVHIISPIFGSEHMLSYYIGKNSPVLKYAWQMWHHRCTQRGSALLETIQRHALKNHRGIMMTIYFTVRPQGYLSQRFQRRYNIHTCQTLFSETQKPMADSIIYYNLRGISYPLEIPRSMNFQNAIPIAIK